MGRLSAAERIEAEILAAHLLCRRARGHDVRKHLRETFACSYTVAIAIVKKVRNEQKAAAEASRGDMLKEAYETLNEAVALAFKNKDVRAVVLCERLRAELGGLLGSEVHIVATTDEPSADEGKGELHLRCLAVMGKSPSELSQVERARFVVRLKEDGDEVMANEAQSDVMN